MVNKDEYDIHAVCDVLFWSQCATVRYIRSVTTKCLANAPAAPRTVEKPR